MTTKTKKERISGEERRTRITTIAAAVFAEKGFSATRTKEIAEIAGISETLVFQHFKTKRDLYTAVLKKLFEKPMKALPMIQNTMQEENDNDVFYTIALTMIQMNNEEPKLMRLAMWCYLEGIELSEIVFGETYNSPLFDILVTYIRQRIGKGNLKNIRPDIVARLFFSSVTMFILNQRGSILGPELDVTDEQAAKNLTDIFMRGLEKQAGT